MKLMFSQFFASLISGIVFLGVLGGGFGVFEVAADECCTEAGYADECWWESAEDDGVTCVTNSDCDITCDKTVTDPSNSNVGLCACTSDADCVSGVCDVDNRCGPSWCNGYLICSCFGGCINAELGTYVNPEAMCTDTTSGYPGTCCEGTFPDGVGGVGYCSDDPTCNSGCTSDADCNDGNPCTQDECIAAACVNTNLDGNINDLDGFGNPIGAACPYDATIYDIECALPACDNGACSVDTTFNEGGPCDADSNECTYGVCASGVCNQHALTDVSTPSFNDVGFEDCCNDDPDPAGVIDDGTDYLASYNDGSDCKFFYCDVTLHDVEFDMGEGSECASLPWASDTDPCSSSACGGGTEAGDCVLTTDVYLDAPCWDTAAMAASTYPSPPDPCVLAYCDGSGTCIPDQFLDGDCTPPSALCELWTCQYNNTTYTTTLFCEQQVSAVSPDPDLERCYDPMTAAQEMGVIGYTEQTVLDSNECAVDDYDADITGIFSACDGYLAGTNNADYVYNFDVSVNPTLYQLEHVAANLNRDGSTGWDPYLHARENCENVTTDTGEQISCNNNQFWNNTYYPDYGGYYSGAPAEFWSASVTVGPWPLRDRTDYNDTFGVDDGIVTEGDWSAQLIVDTWNYSNPMPGGDFELNVIKETHYNNDCKNSAAYLAAPILDNFTSWKERWRGTTNHANYVNRNGTGDDTDCGTGTQDANNPTSAYYRVVMEKLIQADWNMDQSGVSGLQWESVDWGSLYKVSIDPALDPAHLDAALTLWNGSAGKKPCNIKSNMAHKCGGISGGLQGLVVMDGTGSPRKWLEVSNHVTDAKGDYELQTTRVPREFFGFKEVFAGTSTGCAGSTSPGFGASADWALGGTRLDFIPTNDRLNGYMVKVETSPALDNGWLVDPSGSGVAEVCRGVGCITPGSGQVRDFPPNFNFPFSGQILTHYRIDAGGRIDFGNVGMASGVWDFSPNSQKSNSNTGYNPYIAPMWGKIIPCMCSNTKQYELWGFIPVGDKFWKKDTCRSNAGEDTDARVFAQEAQWDGSTVVVVTWDAFDGYIRPTESSSGVCPLDYSSASDRSQLLQFQVVIRSDGRFSFFYKSAEAVVQDVLDYNAWQIGVAGTWHSDPDARPSPPPSVAPHQCDDGVGSSPNMFYTPDNWCATNLGAPLPAGSAEYQCDNDVFERCSFGVCIDLYDPAYWCIHNVGNYDGSTGAHTGLHDGVPGTWQTGE